MNEDDFAAMILDDVIPPAEPTWEKPCGGCGSIIARYRGQGDVVCACGAVYNAGGQRLRDDAPTFGIHGYWGPTPWDDDDY